MTADADTPDAVQRQTLADDLDAIARLAPEWCQYMEEYETWDLGKETIFDLTEALKYWEEDCIVGACQRYVEGRGYTWHAFPRRFPESYMVTVQLPIMSRAQHYSERPSLAAAWVAAVRSLLEANDGRSSGRP